MSKEVNEFYLAELFMLSMHFIGDYLLNTRGFKMMDWDSYAGFPVIYIAC